MVKINLDADLVEIVAEVETVIQKVPVSWTTIKEIYTKAVGLFGKG